MTKFLLALLGMIIAFILSIFVMIHGWGLEVQSWGWVVFGTLAGALIAALFHLADE